MLLIINGDSLSIQLTVLALEWSRNCFVWGRNWIVEYYGDELEASKACDRSF